MDSFVKAAVSVLEDVRRPLTTHEIIHLAIERGFLRTEGLTPHKTLNARLSEHLLEKGMSAVIMRTGPGEFALRAWKDKIPEYVAPRRTFNPIEEDILVLPSPNISQFVEHDGLNYKNISDLKKLVDSSFVMRRLEAEENFEVVQLVSSFLITYRNTVLTYHRSKRLPESRMHDTYCLNFGGHISYEDQMPLFGFKKREFIDLAMRRELDEEVRFTPPPTKLHFKGFLYDSSTSLGQQHIGIVFHVPVKNKNYKIGEKGYLLSDTFETKKNIREKLEEFDSWSQMIGKAYIDGNW